MKFYKIIDLDRAYIGVASSVNFVKRNRISGYFLTAGETNGQFVDIHSQLYRDTWMNPITSDDVVYTQAQIIEISEEEYTTLHNIELQSQQDEEFIPNYEPYIPEEEEPIQEINELDIISENTLQAMKELKIKALSQVCHKTIELGFNFEIHGETHHFSLTEQDQLNLMSLGVMAQTQQLIPYHADGEACEFYTANEINEIIAAATQFKNYNIAYYNSLKTYINTLETLEEISTITYGTSIPEEYKTDVLKVLEC